MTLFTYTLLSVSMMLITYEDVREQAIPVWALGLFAAAGLIKQWAEPNWESWMALSLLGMLIALCQGVFYAIKRTPGLGSGDMALIPLCGLWLSLSDVGLFLCLTGLFGLGIGLIWRHQWKMRSFPLAPAIFLGLCVVWAFFPLL